MSKMTTMLSIVLFAVVVGSAIYITVLKDNVAQLEAEREFVVNQNETLKKQNEILTEDRDATYDKCTTLRDELLNLKDRLEKEATK